ncbi:MAG: alpha-1,2-fucosyltransferase [Bacteroidota bacterium]
MAIGVWTDGRLGNNLFQFAVMYAFSKKLNTHAFFTGNNIWHSLSYFDCRYHFQWQSFWTFLLVRMRYLLKASHPERFLGLTVVNQKNINSPEAISIEDNSYFIGYFQNDAYFSDLLPEIQEILQIRKRYRTQFEIQKADLLSKDYIVLHFRRTDYQIWKHSEGLGPRDLSLPLIYYHRALKEIKHKVESLDNYPIVIVGDQVDDLEEEFSDYPNVRIEHNDPIIDFQILLHGKHLVISNSSFAWWGATLNTTVESVIAPKYWLGFKVRKEYPNTIVRENWEEVDVSDLFEECQR